MVKWWLYSLYTIKFLIKQVNNLIIIYLVASPMAKEKYK